jgi:hypothetical protein
LDAIKDEQTDSKTAPISSIAAPRVRSSSVSSIPAYEDLKRDLRKGKPYFSNKDNEGDHNQKIRMKKSTVMALILLLLLELLHI